jgi:DGQHR domain-containing protein
MKRLTLLKGYQKGIPFYSLLYDPREIIKVVDIPDSGVQQDNQRPWKEKKVKEISKYVAGNYKLSDIKDKRAIGIIPNSPIINLKEKLEIKEDSMGSYLLFPESEEEFLNIFGCFEILDGQHRLIAFSKEYIDHSFKNSEKYDMNFIIFNKLTLDEKRELFMVCNDKQEKVESNLLRQFKKWLHLISDEEYDLYQILDRLNSEDSSPLKGRIIMGGEKITGGLKANQIVKILKNSKVYDTLKAAPDVNAQFKSLTNYLNAWNEIYSGALKTHRKTLGKISGYRYMLYMFDYIFRITKEKNKKFTKDDIKEIINEFYQLKNGMDMFKDSNVSNGFKGETGTVNLAKKHGNELYEYMLKNTDVFNPLDF